MFLRALLAFLALPGVVAFALPLLISRDEPVRNPWGLLLLAAGAHGLLSCTWAFYVNGKGTLAPWSPPEHLVTSGLYRFSRNPMYLAVLLVLIGWALLFESSALSLYAAVVALAFHLRVVLGEEPWLAKTHGAAWEAYRQAVPRWF